FISLSSLFLLMIPHPPISTLFPYTTLFRSSHLHIIILHKNMHHFYLKVEKLYFSLMETFLILQVVSLEYNLFFSFLIGLLPFVPDRKSTRLNSSHVSISYAVFCLKKKIIYF